MSSAGTFSSKLLPDMLNCEKFTEDGRELLQNFHDRYLVKKLNYSPCIFIPIFFLQNNILEQLSGSPKYLQVNSTEIPSWPLFIVYKKKIWS